MTKAEYIEKYGEEAYKKQLEKMKAYDAAHREEKKAYREAHKEERKAYNKTWYATHREERIEKEKSYNATYYSTPQGRASMLLGGYRQKDRKNNLGETTITADWIVDNIFTSSCTYCGETDWHKLGTDRIDNTKAHTPDNCICACASCNKERQDKYSVEEFQVLKRETLIPG